MEDVMMQIGDPQPRSQAFPNASPAEADKQQQPTHRVPTEEQEPLFVSPPPLPWPRVFPGL
jgi:hypothetical protein